MAWISSNFKQDHNDGEKSPHERGGWEENKNVTASS